MNDRYIAHTLKQEALAQRVFKYRLDDMLKGLPAGTTRAVLEDARLRAHETETALAHEADALERWAGLDYPGEAVRKWGQR